MKWKTPVTLLVLLLILLGAAYYGWQSVTAPTASGASPTATTSTPTTACTKQTSVRKSRHVRAKHIVVNVFNAGVITGLAASTSTSLTAKGFRPGEVADAPAGIRAINVTVLSKTVHSPEVRLVAHQFSGPVAIRHGDIAPGVDVVVGNAFRAVDPHAKPVLVLRKKVHSCVPASSATP